MRNSKIGTLVRSALAVALLVGTQWAAAEVVAGTHVKFTNGVGANPGGAFNGLVVSGGSGALNNSFESFCLEFKEYLEFGKEYEVRSVTNHTVNLLGTYATTQDPISASTAWLFTQFSKTALSNSMWGTTDLAKRNTAVQQAIWAMEDESFGVMSSLAISYKNMANTAVSSGNWSGIGNVRVLNLFSKDSTGWNTHAQDQIYMVSSVPEPETYALMLAGLALVGGIARRRRNKATSA